MSDTGDRVELTELDVITRYSLAVRAATADRDELIAALRADLDWLEGERRSNTRPAAAAARPVPARKPAQKQAPRNTAARRTAGQTAGKKSAAKRTPARRSR